MSTSGASQCTHPILLITPSPHATLAGYTHPTSQKRLAATTSSGRVLKDVDAKPPPPWTFPAPLVLPDDALALDPSYPPQSFRSWKHEKDRNQVTPERRTLYVAAPPLIDDADAFIRGWARAPLLDDAGPDGKTAQPRAPDVVEYLGAFYHPLPVRLLPTPFRLTAWDAPRPKKSRAAPGAAQYVALAHGESATRVRVRAGEVYAHQLNLDDILDAAMDALPPDAYALLLLMEHDLHEGDDDEFCVGRAYGGSRVAVVSTARDHPGLDAAQDLMADRAHAWPASHCAAHARRLCEEAEEDTSESVPKKKAGKNISKTKTSQPAPSPEPQPANAPLQAAIAALLAPLPTSSPHSRARAAELLYLSRLTLTAAHELGHTLGLDHCVYYACLMAGSASLAEGARGAPYLCAVCSAKVAAAGEESHSDKPVKGKARKGAAAAAKGTSDTVAEAELERCTRMRALCVRWAAGDMFRALGAWLGGRIAELEGTGGEGEGVE